MGVVNKIFGKVALATICAFRHIAEEYVDAEFQCKPRAEAQVYLQIMPRRRQ